MKKLKKYGLLALFLGLMILQTSCVKRRAAYLERQKYTKENTQRRTAANTDTFYPENITDYSVEDYLKWYKALKAPPKLQLGSYENPKQLTKSEKVADFEYLFKELEESYPFFKTSKKG